MVDRISRAKKLTLSPSELSQDPFFGILVVYLTASLHIAEFNGMVLLLSTGDDSFAAGLQKGERNSFDTVSKEMILVYRVAVFDSFLNNITRYTLAKKPHKALENCQLAASQLLGRKRMAIINDLIEKKAKAIAMDSFSARVRWLESTIGADFALSSEHFTVLKTISNMRNSVVHEGHAFRFELNEELKVEPKFARNSIKNLADYDFNVLGKFVARIYSSAVTNLLDRELHDMEVGSLAAVDPT